jgi:xanthosine utilization system XapX-like protein
MVRNPYIVTLATFIIAALTTATWWTLGRDTTHEVDAATGAVTGPYEAPQVIACAVVLVGLVVVGALVLPAWLAVLAVSLPFTAAWTLHASSNDDSGLWAVGAILVLLGTLVGGTVVTVVTRLLVRNRRTA